MFVRLFTDPLFVSLLLAFYIVLILVVFGMGKARSRGMRWLDSGVKKRKSWRFFQSVARAIRLAFAASETDMQNKFVAAGFYNSQYAVYYMPIKYALLVFGEAGIYYWAKNSGVEFLGLMVFCLIWLVVILIVPDAYLASRARSLKIKISNKLPYLIDLLAVCVQTGMTIEASVAYLSKEMMAFDKDLGHMLGKVNDRMQIVGLEPALEELRVRVPSNEMRSFVMTLNQSLQYGSSIYSVLTTLSSEIREVQMLGIEEKIGKLAAKMSVPLILFIMFPIVILIAAPGVMRML